MDGIIWKFDIVKDGEEELINTGFREYTEPSGLKYGSLHGHQYYHGKNGLISKMPICTLSLVFSSNIYLSGQDVGGYPAYFSPQNK